MNKFTRRFGLLIASACSLLVVWGASVVLSGSPTLMVRDEVLEYDVPAEGSVEFYAHEGLSFNRFGPHGIGRKEWIRGKDRRNRIYLWGDSFIEAKQVFEDDRPGMVLMRRLEELSHSYDTAVFGIGTSGYGLMDGVARARIMEEKWGAPCCHIFFIGTYFEDDLEFVLRDRIGKPPVSKTRMLIRRIRYWFALTIIDKIKNHTHQFLARYQHREEKALPREKPKEEVLSGIKSVFCHMRSTLKAPVVVAYCPNSVATLVRGGVNFDDKDADLVPLVASMAKGYGIDFVDFSGALKRLYDERGILGRGFINMGGLGNGHLNKDGIKAVFEDVAKYIKDNYDF